MDGEELDLSVYVVDTPLSAPIKFGNLQIHQMHIAPHVRYEAYGGIPRIVRLAQDKQNPQSRDIANVRLLERGVI
jgi:hypothetical protein